MIGRRGFVNQEEMSMVRKLGAALVFAGFIATGMVTFGTTLHAAGHPTPGYCKVLPAAIANATKAGLTELAAYLQSIYDAQCQ